MTHPGDNDTGASGTETPATAPTRPQQASLRLAHGAGTPDDAASGAAPAGSSISPGALAEVLTALPPRVARRLDSEPGLATAWRWRRDGERLVVSAGDQRVTLPAGHVTDAEQIVCDCLLAPRCLHRAAVANALPIAEDLAEAPGGDASPGSPPAASPGKPAPAHDDGIPAAARESASTDVGGAPAGPPERAQSAPSATVEPPPHALAPPQREAADRAFRAGAEALAAGAQSSGAVRRAELLQAAHQARVAGLHRLAAAAIKVATGIDRLARCDAGFAAARYAEDLYELLTVAWHLGAGDEPHEPATPAELSSWIGRARRAFDSMPATMLHAVACERVETDTGYAGVVTHFVDASGTSYQFGDVRPGGADEIANAYRGTTRLGSLALGHVKLSRARVFAQGLTVSAEGRLGSGQGASATSSGLSDWSADPLRTLWRPPATEQLARASADGSLVYLQVTTAGAGPRGLTLLPTAGAALTAIPAPGSERLLRLLAQRPIELWVVARVLAPGEVRLLAIGPPPGVSSLRLAPEWAGRLMVGLDEAPPGLVPEGEAGGGDRDGLKGGAPGEGDHGADGAVIVGRADVPLAEEAGSSTPVEPPAALGAMRLALTRASLGGRLAIGSPAAGSIGRLSTQLMAALMPVGAALLADAHRAALRSERDVLGEHHFPPAVVFAAAWLRAEVYVRAAVT